MADPLNYSGEVASLSQSGGLVTLVEGSCFSLSGRSGDIFPDSPQGVFFLDSRMLSLFELRLDGYRPEPLTVSVDSPFEATFVLRGRPRAGQADSNVLIMRKRSVGWGCHEEIHVRNHGTDGVSLTLELRVGVDFASLFAVKEGRFDDAEPASGHADSTRISFRSRDEPPREVEVAVDTPPARSGADSLCWDIELPARGTWSASVDLSIRTDGHLREPTDAPSARSRIDEAEERLRTWRSIVPAYASDVPGLDDVLASTVRDLGSLRIFDPEHPDLPVVAAGAPWFMTLFGRDSLLTSYMALLGQPRLAEGVLSTLARLQGQKEDADTEEQPGRILHEVRFEEATSSAFARASRYYGTADATPLFVMLLGEAFRWGMSEDLVQSLLPAADRSLEWVDNYGDRDGDGYVEYKRLTPHGLFNQGWKDSQDGITFRDGTIPELPIALAEVQGYVYAARLARADIAEAFGDDATATELRRRAEQLKESFNRDFWVADAGWFALGLDGNKRQIDACGSNMGHCLWTGIVDDEKAPRVAELLLSPQMDTGWGIRTLSSDMAAFNPLSYHNGSVWPHDTAICVAGLARYGYRDRGQSVLQGLVAAGEAADGRLPELFAGLDRADLGTPVAYPSSCSPQAWAAASPLLLTRVLLGFDPDLPRGRVRFNPALPDGATRLSVRGLHLGPHVVDLVVDADGHRITGLPDDVTQRS